MAEPISARTDNDHREALDRMVARGEADSPSEALRQTSQAELARRGYMNGHGSYVVSAAFAKIGEVLGILGMALLAATLFWPVSARWPALVTLIVAVVCYGISRGVVNWEPQIIEQIFGNGEKA